MHRPGPCLLALHALSTVGRRYPGVLRRHDIRPASCNPVPGRWLTTTSYPRRASRRSRVRRQVDAVRAPAEPYPPSEFPSDVAAWIDAERRAAFRSSRPQFVSEYTLCVTFLPPKEVYGRTAAFFVRGASRAIAWDAVHPRRLEHGCRPPARGAARRARR
jgi:hypothetical protein